jgi:hypothetical protein
MCAVRLAAFTSLGLAIACQVAPAESPDEVVQRENARVEAAKKRAEAQGRQKEEDAEYKKRVEDEARAVAKQRDEDKRNAAKRQANAECVADRADRRRHIQDALDRAAKARARGAELDPYIAKYCSRKQVVDYTTQEYKDDRGVTRSRQVQSGTHDEVACPPEAPPELRPGGPGMPSGTVQVQASADERAKNDRCQDVQDLLGK